MNCTLFCFVEHGLFYASHFWFLWLSQQHHPRIALTHDKVTTTQQLISLLKFASESAEWVSVREEENFFKVSVESLLPEI